MDLSNFDDDGASPRRRSSNRTVMTEAESTYTDSTHVTAPSSGSGSGSSMAFSSHEEAQEDLFRIIQHWVVPASFRPFDDALAFYSDPATMAAQLNQWQSSLRGLERRALIPREGVRTSLALRAHHLVARVFSSYICAYGYQRDERQFLAHDVDFGRIIDETTRFLWQSMASGGGMQNVEELRALNMIAPLFFTVTRCRHSEIRRRALHLLNSMPMVQVGAWNSRLAFYIARFMLELEEGDSGQPPAPSPWPALTDVLNIDSNIEGLSARPQQWRFSALFVVNNVEIQGSADDATVTLVVHFHQHPHTESAATESFGQRYSRSFEVRRKSDVEALQACANNPLVSQPGEVG